MLYRKLGKTNLEVSVLGLGCSGLGGVFGDIEVNDAVRTLHCALDEGINYLDTAPFYGETLSETNVGIGLRGVPRDRYVISSKAGRYGMTDHDFTYSRVKQGLEASLQRLGCEYLDLVILHDVEFVPLEQVIGEGLRALHDARAEGKLRYIGASGLPLKIYPALLSVAELDAVISYANYTLQNTMLEGILPLLEAYHLGVINASPLALGLLTPQGPRDWHLGSDVLKEKCREAAAWCNRHGVDIAELGMQFALANTRIHTTLSGALSVEEVKKNVASVGKTPNPQLVEAVRHILTPVYGQAWPAGRAEYN
ncbi:MAG: aldo/keto reductase [Bryobacteraceae bacterium]